MKISTEQISINYTVANDQPIEPRKATTDSAGHDLFINKNIAALFL